MQIPATAGRHSAPLTPRTVRPSAGPQDHPTNEDLFVGTPIAAPLKMTHLSQDPRGWPKRKVRAESTKIPCMRLLLVEDELDIQTFLLHSLEEAGYQVDAARDAKTAERLAVETTYDILVVDLGLPDKDGISLILRLRQMGVEAPVLILSARRSVDDRVRGLEQGGDDYLTKPFALAELLARLRNLLKRNSPAGNEATKLRVLDLELDLLRREATRSGELLQLTPQEFVLLEYLCRNAGRVVTRSMILDKVWGMRIQPDTNVVDVHIYRLRGKVDGKGQQPMIRTLRGVGYVLKDR
jgi:DNA-binding response OmpR family regulator